MRVPNPDSSNAVLIGTAVYQSAQLADIPAVYNNLVQLAATMTDPEIGGFVAARCTTILNPVDGRAVYEALREPVAAATDTFLVYFTGHGLLGTRGELYLAVANTDPDILSVSALAFDVVKEVFRKSRAVHRILILDCCYSGRATDAFMGTVTDTALAQVELPVEVGSTITLASAPANVPALAPPGAPYTAFTGEMIQLLRASWREEDPPLTLEALYRQLIRTAAIRHLPEPQMRGTGAAGELTLTRIGKHSSSQGKERNGRIPPITDFLGAVLDNDGIILGTCFQIASGVFVTAGHVVASAYPATDDAEVGMIVRVEPITGGAAFDSRVESVDQKHNIAVMHSTMELPSTVAGLTDTDDLSLSAPVVIVGAAFLDPDLSDSMSNFRFMTAPGTWEGLASRAGALLGRVRSDSVVPGMSGAPVIRVIHGRPDGMVVGVVVGRYNSADGRLQNTVWVTLTEHVKRLIDVDA
jgi:Trypsin-like peptidase domain/Caspase domain